MPTMDEYAKAPGAERLTRLARTPDELAVAIRGQSETALARRPDPKNCAAKEVASHDPTTRHEAASRSTTS
jgi:hypothetical protein